MSYTEEFIETLIGCEKIVIESPGKMKEERGNCRANFVLCSADNQYTFRCFIRQNMKFAENFSVGIDYDPREEKGRITLLRCNGPHGEHFLYDHHIGCHIHKAKADRINQGLKAEGYAEPTTEYATLDDAIQFFVRYINIRAVDRERYFPPPSGQTNLFD